MLSCLALFDVFSTCLLEFPGIRHYQMVHVVTEVDVLAQYRLHRCSCAIRAPQWQLWNQFTPEARFFLNFQSSNKNYKLLSSTLSLDSLLTGFVWWHIMPSHFNLLYYRKISTFILVSFSLFLPQILGYYFQCRVTSPFAVRNHFSRSFWFKTERFKLK